MGIIQISECIRIFLTLCSLGQNMSAHKKISFLGITEVGKKQWAKKRERKKEAKVSVNNAPLRLRTPPLVSHANCLDQKDISRKDQNQFFLT